MILSVSLEGARRDLAAGRDEEMSWKREYVSRVGEVVPGRGQATRFFAGRRELYDYFGAEPQPGTLNIVLDWPIQFQAERAIIGFDEHRQLWPAMLEGQRSLIHRWNNCPLHVIELISPYRFQIKKGDRIHVAFNVADTAAVSWQRLLGWSWLWLAHRKRAYSDDKYFDWANDIADRYPDYFAQQKI
jgi:hypothetical protein